jgi:hypothetical protein
LRKMQTACWPAACLVLLFAACGYAATKPSPALEHGVVISQDITTTRNGVYAAPIGTAAIAVPIYGRSNVVVVDTGSTRYTWSEATRRGTIILTVNAQVEFYRDGDWFVVLDSKGGKHRFALIGATAREQKPTTEAKPVMAETFTSGGLPGRWQSLTTGGAKVVRKDGDRLYVENVQSEARKQAGCFGFADLTKQAEIYTGTFKYSCVCQYTSLGKVAPETRRYSYEQSEEIALLSPTRIEGRSMQFPEDTKLDCETATFSKPAVWMNFVWIPQ